jgi:hypothetical protein
MRETDPILEQRVEEILEIRLDGAKEWDARRYVAEKEAADEAPWKLPEGGNPLSRRQIRNYIREADRRIARSTQATRQRRVARHIAYRERLFARAVSKGDERTALAVLDSLAKLLDLFPTESDALLREMAALRKELAELKARQDDGGSGTQTPGGGPDPGGEGGPVPAP